MKVNLCDIMSVVGKEFITDVTLDKVSGCLQGEELVVTCEEPFSLKLKHTQKDILSVDAKVCVLVERLCGRCLEPVSKEYMLCISRDIDVSHKKAMDSTYEESMADTDEISYIEDCNLDVDMLVLDELYTILPMMVLCKEDCKGICKVCGTNLNKSTCDCDQTVPDPRMAVFSDIFNQFKEV